MDGYDETTYGERIAPVYDYLYEALFDTDAQVAFLARYAPNGKALELAIGTGRIAVPLKARGVEVHGIDASEAMVAKLRARPGGEDIPVTMGNFADVNVEGTYDLIFVVFNTLFALRSQEEQIRCFRNAARRLDDDGVFVVSAFVPDTRRFERHQNLNVTRVGVDEVMIDAGRHDPVSQRVESQHLIVRGGKVEMYPVVVRYAWPSELDLMARLAGLQLRERFGGFKGEPFTSDSVEHVSVYEKP